MSQHTRREFLENSMLATAAVAATSAVPLPAVTAAAQSKSPNERLRVAVLGVHNRGRVHIAEFGQRKDCEVVAIVDPDEAVGNRNGVEPVYKKTGKKPAFYRDMRKVFEDPSIDIVSIATPNHWHSLAAIWAMQAGKDVYVEKPVSHNVSEGRRVVQAARKYKKICQTGTQSRSMTGARALMEFIHSGAIGEIKKARGLCYNQRRPIGPRGIYDPPASADYNLFLGPSQYVPLTRPRLHYDWHWQWPTGNGDLGNQGIHQMDLARWGLGLHELSHSVQSYGGRLGYIDAGDTANTQVCIHDYGKKQLVFEVRGLKTKPHAGVKIGVIFYGSDGYAIMPRYDSGTVFDKNGKVLKTFSGGDQSDHFSNFVEAIRSRDHKHLNADILEGHLSSALCHLGNISYRMGGLTSAQNVESDLKGDEAHKTFQRFARHLVDNNMDLKTVRLHRGPNLPLDPKTETFTGPLAEKAGKLLTRNYRKPFVVPTEAQL